MGASRVTSLSSSELAPVVARGIWGLACRLRPLALWGIHSAPSSTGSYESLGGDTHRKPRLIRRLDMRHDDPEKFVSAEVYRGGTA
jgi:hypothetical protein